MSADDHVDQAISLHEIEKRSVQSPILGKVVKGYFERVGKPAPNIEDHTLTLSCVDSRLLPAKVLDLGEGQTYSATTVANICPPLTDEPYDDQSIEVAAALEYAVRHKGVNEIDIIGHGDCGGAEVRLNQNPTLPMVSSWMNKHVCLDGFDSPLSPGILEAIRRDAPWIYRQARRGAEKECISTSYRNIKAMPFIREAVDTKKLALLGLMCNLEKGKLEVVENSLHSNKAVARHLEKFRRFKKEGWGPNGPMPALVSNGQHPKALIVTGISPYVAPENVFGIEPGDSFIHRRLGGHYHHDRTPGGLSATIEFAVAAKNVPFIFVIGHKNDVNRDYAQGLMDPYPLVTAFMEKSTPNLRAWRDYGMHPDLIHQKSLKDTFYNVSQHPAAREAVQKGKLSILALLIDHERGTMDYYDPQQDRFLGVTPPAA